MSLLGADGKELNQPQRPAMSRQEKFNMVFMVFTIMTREERQYLCKMLRPLRRELDVKYPNGMTEDDIKRDVEKIQTEMTNGTQESSVSIVPNPEGQSIPVVTQEQPLDGVPVQPEDNQGC